MGTENILYSGNIDCVCQLSTYKYTICIPNTIYNYIRTRDLCFRFSLLTPQKKGKHLEYLII